MRKTSHRVLQYDVLRVITTLLVVISHGHYHAFQSGFGGIDYSALMTGGDFSWKLIGMITEFINSFTMPTFMALGGALFYRSMRKGKFPTLGTLAVDKAKRLLIPFLVVSVLYSFPLKLVTGYYSGSDNVVWDFLVGQLLVQGNTHLWYLTAMFLDFLIVYLLDRYVKIPKVAKLAILGAISVAVWADPAPVLLVAYPLRFAVWFYAGYCFESVRKLFRNCTGFGWGALGCVATVVVYLVCRPLIDAFGLCGVVRLAGQKLLLPAVAGLTLYAIASGFAGTKITGTKVYGCLSRNSLGIYLYSDPLNYVVLALGSVLGGTFLFGSGAGVLVLYFLRIGVTLGGSILVTELLRKCKVKHII